ncbi:unnamed protein product [Rhizoctonia solani]|uniref:Uncharacterized protein n=1 Tax=Rhizoctonia solani TaxID=456999 RepID=A0A8H3AVE2_9AGAM|nr:unnamed protein product [Rhizoctonia solani]
MSFRHKFRKLKSDSISRDPQKNEEKDDTQDGPSQPSSVSGPGASPHWTRLRTFVKALEQAMQPFHPLKAAISELAGSIENHESVFHLRKEYEILYYELEELFQALQKHCTESIPPTITATVEALCKSVQKEMVDIRQKKGKRKLRDYLEAEQDVDAVMACYHRIQGHLQRIVLNADIYA